MKNPSPNDNPSPAEDKAPEPASGPFVPILNFFRRFASKSGALKAESLRNYGVAALISYGMFDALTYSLSFLLSLRAYIAAGKVLTWKTLPQVRK